MVFLWVWQIIAESGQWNSLVIVSPSGCQMRTFWANELSKRNWQWSVETVYIVQHTWFFASKFLLGFGWLRPTKGPKNFHEFGWRREKVCFLADTKKTHTSHNLSSTGRNFLRLFSTNHQFVRQKKQSRAWDRRNLAFRSLQISCKWCNEEFGTCPKAVVVAKGSQPNGKLKIWNTVKLMLNLKLSEIWLVRFPQSLKNADEILQNWGDHWLRKANYWANASRGSERVKDLNSTDQIGHRHAFLVKISHSAQGKFSKSD